ncbi:protein ENHANCED DISEASE RESISTANCE 2-like [Vigna radiata var. radiata]|uniref:Protein ENHANCED DISEASE RESISTANCE 2-like n=1 Tax=Vigna radiata var. radiata TaxID=3916 RepID=A0A3Q0EZX0_VIGRR|nr:protein ENHANCED DISEASE RESISTANCE 2-like [Vigna radiata var. radiata]
MEGWLFIFTFNRLGLCCSHKRYFILKESFLRSFKAKPMSQMKEPNRSTIIDSNVRVIDNGRETIKKKVFFTFTMHSALDQRDQVKLGASSSEEAAKWIRSLKDAQLKENSNLEMNFLVSSKKEHSSLR